MCASLSDDSALSDLLQYGRGTFPNCILLEGSQELTPSPDKSRTHQHYMKGEKNSKKLLEIFKSI